MTKRRLLLIRAALLIQAVILVTSLVSKPVSDIWIWRETMDAVIERIHALELDGQIVVSENTTRNTIPGALAEAAIEPAKKLNNSRFRTSSLLLLLTGVALAASFWPTLRPPIASPS